ncbi:MAG: hypothetical protein K2O38_07770 [Muribaculaceae bacterium]|nr:hypothetical protein [Muribaculaceae bacterium]
MTNEGNSAIVEVTDSGKGIERKNFKTIFNPEFTTKKRGWGLGLTLAKRIIEIELSTNKGINYALELR